MGTVHTGMLSAHFIPNLCCFMQLLNFGDFREQAEERNKSMEGSELITLTILQLLNGFNTCNHHCHVQGKTTLFFLQKMYSDTQCLVGGNFGWCNIAISIRDTNSELSFFLPQTAAQGSVSSTKAPVIYNQSSLFYNSMHILGHT